MCLRTRTGHPPSLFLTRRAAERAVANHIAETGLKAARTIINQVTRGFFKLDRGWEAVIIPRGQKSAYLL